MNKLMVSLLPLLVVVSIAHAQGGPRSANVHADNIGDSVTLDGGGSFDAASGQITLGGRFRVKQDLASGPLGGLRDGEGTHWQATAILPSSTFKCSGADPGRTVVTDDDTIVFEADFFRAGDGARASFHAKVFVSAQDENPDAPGVQNVWIQGVGCDDASVDVH